MYYTPLTLSEQESLGHKAHFEALPRTLISASLYLVSWITKTLRVGPTGRYTRSHIPFFSLPECSNLSEDIQQQY